MPVEQVYPKGLGFEPAKVPARGTNKQIAQAKADALRMRAMGFDRNTVCRALGIWDRRLEGWRRSDPQFHADWSKAVQTARLARALKKQKPGEKPVDRGFTVFRKSVFGQDTFPHQRQWIEWAEDPDADHILIVTAPGQSKSTVFLHWILKGIVDDPLIRCAYMTFSDKEAQKRVGFIRRVIEENPRVTELAGMRLVPEKGDKRPWSEDKFMVAARDFSAGDAQLDYCVDPETEVLTSDGWKFIDGCADGMDILTLNPGTGLSEWLPAKFHRFEAKTREMVRLRHRHHDSLTTPDHRWLVDYHPWRLNTRGLPPERVWKTTTELNSAMCIPVAAPCSNLPTETKYSDALVEALAWYWTEGTRQAAPNGRLCGISIYQSIKNPHYVDRIRAALTAAFGPATPRRKPGGVGVPEPTWNESLLRGEIVTFSLNVPAARILDEHAPGKVVNPSFIAALTRAQLQLFVDTSLDADGWRTSQTAISQADRRRLEPFSMACSLLGIAANIHPAGGNGYSMTLRKRSRVTVSSMVRETVTTEGMVWCPETPNGTFLARRNGFVFFTGNTLASYGATTQIAGSRIDRMVIDDIDGKRNLSQNERLKIYEKVVTEAEGRLDTHGRMVMVCNRWDVEDVAGLIERNHQENPELGLWKIYTSPAVLRWPKQGVEGDHGEVLWPQKWGRDPKFTRADAPITMKTRYSTQRAMEYYQRKRARQGEKLFELVYQCNPSGSTTRAFDDADIDRALERGKNLTLSNLPDGPTLCTQDPGGEKGCATLAGVVTEKVEHHLSLTDPEALPEFVLADLSYADGLKTVGMLGVLEDFSRRFHPRWFGIEAQGPWKSYVDHTGTIESLRKHGVNPRPFSTGANKRSDDIGITAMDWFIREKLVIPSGDAVTRDRFAPLVSQLRAYRPPENIGLPGSPRLIYRGGAYDCLIALWLAFRMLKEHLYGTTVNTGWLNQGVSKFEQKSRRLIKL